jgi:Insertion element 4 transposase N-terminal
VVWLVIGMCIFRDLSIRELVSTMDLALRGRRGSWIVQARARLGDQPLRWIFEPTAAAWAHASAWTHAWRDLAVYGSDRTPCGCQTPMRTAPTLADRTPGGTAPAAILGPTRHAHGTPVRPPTRVGAGSHGQTCYAASLPRTFRPARAAVVASS